MQAASAPAQDTGSIQRVRMGRATLILSASFIASKNKFTVNGTLPAGLKFLNAQTMAAMFDFPNDMSTVATEPNRLNNQILVRYFEEEWAHYSP